MGAPFVEMEEQILAEHEHLGHAPVKFRTVERNDVLAIAGAAVGSFALAWLIFTQLTAAGMNLGMFVTWYVIFLLMVWFIGKEQYDAVRARDLVARSVFWTVGIMLVVPMVAITEYTISKCLTALKPNFFQLFT